MRKIPTLLLLSFLGLIVSVIIIRIHYYISTNPGENSFCHISDVIDCDAFLASHYAKLGFFFSAELAFGYYLITIWGLVEAWGAKKPLLALSYTFICAVFASIYSVILNLLSVVKLGVICPLCLILSVINIIILLFLLSEMKVPLLQLPGRIGRKLLVPKSLLFYGVGTVVIFGMALLFARKLNPQAQYSFGFSPEPYLKSFYAFPKTEISLLERAVLGNPDATVTVLVFSDLHCQSCRQFETVLKPLLEQHRGQIRIIYLNFPFNSSCNPEVSETRYPLACVAAKEALCTYQHGKFSEYHDWVFKNQARYESHSNLANELGIEQSSFENCLVSEKTDQLLKEDIAIATQFSVERTPTVYINGRQFLDWRDAERFQLILKSELSRSIERK